MRRLLSLAVVLALILALAGGRSLVAQTWLDVQPDGGEASAQTNQTGLTVQFTVTNTSPFQGTVTLSCGVGGSVTDCSVPGSIELDGMATENVTATYSTGGPGSGSILLTADIGYGPEQGDYHVTVTAPPFYAVAVTFTSGPDTVFTGNQQTWRFTVHNLGNTTTTYSLTGSAGPGLTFNYISSTSVQLVPDSDVVITLWATAGLSTMPSWVKLKATGPAADSTSHDVLVFRPNQFSVAYTHSDRFERSGCVTVGAGPNGGIQCGDLVYAHTFPGYRSMAKVRALTLIYNSGTAFHRPVVVVDYTTFAGDSLPDLLKVDVKRVSDGVVIQTHYYNTTGFSAIATQVHRMTIPMVLVGTGANHLDVVLTPSRLGQSWTPLTARTYLLSVSRNTGPYGGGWWLAGLERLRVLAGDSLLLIRGDNSLLLFKKSGATSYTAPPGEYSTITKVGTKYRRTLPGGRVSVWYRSNGLVDSIVELNPTPNKAVYSWWSDSLLTGITDPTGKTTSFYHTSGRLDSIVIPSVGTARLFQSQDAAAPGFVLDSIWDPDTVVTRFTYSTWYRMTSSTARGTGTISYTYDLAARVDSVAMPAGVGAPALQYRAWQLSGSPGNAGTQQNPAPTALRDTVRISASSWRASPVFKADTAWFFTDRFEFPTAYSLPAIGGGVIGRDSKGQAVEVTTPAGGYYLQEWNGDGNLTKVTRRTWGGWSNPVDLMVVTSYGYDPGWKTLTSVSPPAGGGMTFGYDAWGRRAWAQDALGHQTTFTYNSRGQLRTAQEPGEPVPTTYAYDTTSTWNLLSVADSAGTTSYVYFANGSDIQSVLDPMQNGTGYTYDAIKRVTSVLQNNLTFPPRIGRGRIGVSRRAGWPGGSDESAAEVHG